MSHQPNSSSKLLKSSEFNETHPNLFKKEILQQGNALRNCYKKYMHFKEYDDFNLNHLLGLKDNADISDVIRLNSSQIKDISPLGNLFLNLKEIISNFMNKVSTQDLVISNSKNRTIKKNSIFKIIALGMGTSLFSAIPARYRLPIKISPTPALDSNNSNEENILIDFKVLFLTEDAGEFQYLPFYKNMVKNGKYQIDQDDDIIPIMLFISQSGESGEIIQILNKLKENNFPKRQMWALTNNPNSTLSQNAGVIFPLFAGEELSVTNKTYLSQLLIINIIAEILPIFLNSLNKFSIKNKCNIINLESLNSALRSFKNDFSIDFQEVINSVDFSLKIFDNLQEELCNFFEGLSLNSSQSHEKSLPDFNVNHIEFVARGPSLATANQASLNTKEVVKIPSEALSGSMFRHGPIEIINERFLSVLISSIEEGARNLHKMAENITNKWIDINANEKFGGKVILIANKDHIKEEIEYSKNGETNELAEISSMKLPITNSSIAPIEIVKKGRITYILHSISNPSLAPIFEIIPIQALFYGLAFRKGINPGQFKYSSKITKE